MISANEEQEEKKDANEVSEKLRNVNSNEKTESSQKIDKGVDILLMR